MYNVYCQVWMDQRLTWNASEADDIKYIFVDVGKMWVPDVVLYNKWVYCYTLLSQTRTIWVHYWTVLLFLSLAYFVTNVHVFVFKLGLYSRCWISVCYCTLFVLGQCSVLSQSHCPVLLYVFCIQMFIIGQIKMDGWMYPSSLYTAV